MNGTSFVKHLFRRLLPPLQGGLGWVLLLLSCHAPRQMQESEDVAETANVCLSDSMLRTTTLAFDELDFWLADSVTDSLASTHSGKTIVQKSHIRIRNGTLANARVSTKAVKANDEKKVQSSSAIKESRQPLIQFAPLGGWGAVLLMFFCIAFYIHFRRIIPGS